MRIRAAANALGRLSLVAAMLVSGCTESGASIGDDDDADDDDVASGGCETRAGDECATFVVPDTCPTIQAAIDVTLDCDTVLVRPGLYNEQIDVPMRSILITSDPADGGDELVDYTGVLVDKYGEDVEVAAHRQALRRTLETIIDGSGFPGGTEGQPNVDFEEGVTRDTVFDGFTVQYMPSVDHSIPGHSHVLECRGSSPTILNNIIRFNGSTGVGSHASFVETAEDGSVDDFRQSNIEFVPAPYIQFNISHHNEGLGFGNNHYSRAEIYDNESFRNRTLELDHSCPGIGARHGSRPVIERNIVYENGWGGILVSQESLQGTHPVDLRTTATIRDNLVYANGAAGAPEDKLAGIGVDGAGTAEEPVLVEGNTSYDALAAGIGTRNEASGEGWAGDDTFVEIRDNVVHGSIQSGITCAGGPVGYNHCVIERNVVYDNATIGVVFGGMEYPEGGTGVVHNNTVAFNGTAGFMSATPPVEVRNNIFYANGTAGMIHPVGEHDHNLLSGNNGQAADCGGNEPWCINPQYGLSMGGQGAGTGDLWSDPLFVDADGRDFQLQLASPAIDAGVVVNDDEYLGAAPDMGAFEHSD